MQQAAVDALVQAGRIEPVPVDAARAAAFVRQAEERISQLALLTSASVQYGVAYDAAHDLGEALLAAYGYRTTNGSGQHEAVGRYLRAVLDQPPGNKAARQFDQIRRGRNQDRYAARPVGAADAEHAAKVANELMAALGRQGLTAD